MGEPLVITITPIRYENVPPALQTRFDAIWKEGDRLFDAGDKAGCREKIEEARNLLKPYEKQKPAPDKPSPPPTGTSSPPPEGAHKTGEYKVLSLAPSVELTNRYPVPYNIHAKASDDLLFS